MKKGIMTIALVAAMMLIATPAQAAWDDTYAVLSSAELTANAWEALGKGDTMGGTPSEKGFVRAVKWSKICAYYYGEKGLLQNTAGYMLGNQASAFYSIYTLAVGGTASTTQKISDLYGYCWAHSDVATCYFIMGEAYRGLGDTYDTKAHLAYGMIKTGGAFENGLCAVAADAQKGTGELYYHDGTTGYSNVWTLRAAGNDGDYLVDNNMGTFYPAGIGDPTF